MNHSYSAKCGIYGVPVHAVRLVTSSFAGKVRLCSLELVLNAKVLEAVALSFCWNVGKYLGQDRWVNDCEDMISSHFWVHFTVVWHNRAERRMGWKSAVDITRHHPALVLPHRKVNYCTGCGWQASSQGCGAASEVRPELPHAGHNNSSSGHTTGHGWALQPWGGTSGRVHVS